MKDNEIIKSLERMSEEDPEGFSSDILNFINRQQAEIKKYEKLDELAEVCIEKQQLLIAELRRELQIAKEEILKLKNDCFCLDNERQAYIEALDTAVVEAIKEFAERLKEEKFKINYCGSVYNVVDVDEIDNIKKEMAGDTE